VKTEIATKASLAGGALGAIVASACCLGPLVLITLGVSGAWIGNLSALEPYRPVFIGLAVAFMTLAYRRIFVTARAAEACEPGTNRVYRALFWIVSALVVVAMTFPYFVPLFY
jgi:mercuric ion transport protein